MRSILHFTGYNLKRLFMSPRPYIVFLALFAVMQIGIGGANTYLIENGQKLQAVELYVLMHSSSVCQLIFILGLLLLLGDAPFLKEGMSFRLIRTNRVRWLIGQILSCIIISAIYLLVLELLVLILFRGHITVQNSWSDSVILAAQLGNGMAINIEMAVQFPIRILQAGTPYAMFGLTFLYSLLLYAFFSVLLIACNLRLRTGIGCLAVTVFWCWKLMLNYVLDARLLWYLSPCNLACLSEQTFQPTMVLYTVMYFLVICCCLCLLALRFTRSGDLLKGDYA